MKIKLGKRKILKEGNDETLNEIQPGSPLKGLYRKFKQDMAPDIEQVEQEAQTKGKKWYDYTIKDLYKKWADSVDIENPDTTWADVSSLGTKGIYGNVTKSWRGDTDAAELQHFKDTEKAKAAGMMRKQARKPAAEDHPYREPVNESKNFHNEWRSFLKEGTTFPTAGAYNTGGGEGTPTLDEPMEEEIDEARDWKGDPYGHEPTHPSENPGVDDGYGNLEKAKKTQHDYDKELWDKLSAKNLPWSEESVSSEIERAKRLDGESAVDGDALGQFIVDHGDGDAQQALNHLEDEIQEMEGMRKAINDLIGDEMGQEINDMMDEEDEEIQFAKDNPEYTTRTFDDEEEDL